MTNKPPSLISLILLVSFPSVSCVLVSPTLPAIRDYYGVSNMLAQQVITIFVLGYAIGQLLYSPIANRYGRKPAIYAGISLYLIGCLISLFSIYNHGFHWLLTSRLLMALGAGSGMAITYTIINDYFSVQQSRSITSYAVLAFSFMPALGVALGGVLTSHVCWQACFYFLTLYGVFLIYPISRLPETLPEKIMDALKPKRLLSNYVNAFRCLRLLLFSSIFGFTSALIYIIASAAPFIGIDIIGMKASVYGLLLIIPYCGQFIGATWGGRLSHRVSAPVVMNIGFMACFIGTFIMLTAFWMGDVNTYTLMIPMALVMLGIPMIYSNANVLALVGYPDKASGSSIMSFITMMTCFVMTWLITASPTHHAVIMPLMFVLCLLLGLVVYIVGYRRYLRVA